MTMTIETNMLGLDNPVYYTEAFRNQIEDALSWLQSHPQTKAQPVDAGLAYQFEADFYGLCNYYNITYPFHWIVMRMSGLVSADEAGRELNQILIPNPNVISQMASNYNTLPAPFIPDPYS